MKKLWMVLIPLFITACQSPADSAIELMKDPVLYDKMEHDYLKIECKKGNREACQVLSSR